ncbi:MAG: hypothetical protein Fur0010_00300 [Bdellovibrio sp.]
MRDWNLSLNYMMLVPPTYVAFHMMKKNLNFLLWVEMIGFLATCFSILFQFTFGIQGGIYLVLGSQLANFVQSRVESNDVVRKKSLWVARKLPFLIFLIGISVGRNLPIEYGWMIAGILSGGLVVQGFIFYRGQFSKVMTFLSMPLMIVLLYLIGNNIEGIWLVHLSSGVVVTCWMMRTFFIAKELKTKNENS